MPRRAPRAGAALRRPPARARARRGRAAARRTRRRSRGHAPAPARWRGAPVSARAHTTARIARAHARYAGRLRRQQRDVESHRRRLQPHGEPAASQPACSQQGVLKSRPFARRARGQLVGPKAKVRTRSAAPGATVPSAAHSADPPDVRRRSSTWLAGGAAGGKRRVGRGDALTGGCPAAAAAGETHLGLSGRAGAEARDALADAFPERERARRGGGGGGEGGAGGRAQRQAQVPEGEWVVRRRRRENGSRAAGGRESVELAAHVAHPPEERGAARLRRGGARAPRRRPAAPVRREGEEPLGRLALASEGAKLGAKRSGARRARLGLSRRQLLGAAVRLAQPRQHAAHRSPPNPREGAHKEDRVRKWAAVQQAGGAGGSEALVAVAGPKGGRGAGAAGHRPANGGDAALEVLQADLLRREGGRRQWRGAGAGAQAAARCREEAAKRRW